MTQGQSARRPTRGVRNNNPGNIRRVSGVTWQGQAKEQTDAEFVVFVSPEMGVRALVRTLLTYNKAHKLASVRGIINRWAPPNGYANGRSYKQNTSAYIDAVAKELGRALGETVNVDARLDVDSYRVMRALATAIIAHENSGHRYPDRVINEGLRLAGVTDAPSRPLLATGEVQGAVLGAGATALLGAAEAAKAFGEAREQLMPAASMSPLITALIILFSLAASGLVLWARFSARRKTGA
ncbi:hypothetical protein ACFPIF_09940 [Brevundimonas faecalis]|uniref:hypothetical protein n=1 Tax=Brevundimonas faecalis TaxID=947378 RepID=UPI0036109775